MENYYLLVENLVLDGFLTLLSGFLNFSFSRRTFYDIFVIFCTTFSLSSRFSPLDQYFLVVPKLRPDFVADVTIGPLWFTQTCCDVSSSSSCSVTSTSLLYFSDVTVGLLLYLILKCLLFSDVTIVLHRWSPSWRTRLINHVLRTILPLLPLHRVLWQSTAAWSRQDFYRIILGVCYNHSIVSC